MEERDARSVIVDAAIRAIDRLGTSVSMDEIAREADTSKPRLYRHFADRSDLAVAIAQQLSDEIFDAVQPDVSFLLRPPHDIILHAVSGYANVVAEHPNVFRFLATGGIQRESGFPTGILRGFSERLYGLFEPLSRTAGIETSGLEMAISGLLGVPLLATNAWLPAASSGKAADPAEFIATVTPLVWGVLDAYFQTKGLDVDVDQPIFMTLAEITSAKET